MTDEVFNKTDDIPLSLQEQLQFNDIERHLYDDIIVALQEKGITFNDTDELLVWLTEQGVAPHESTIANILLHENAVRMHINQFQAFPSIDLSTIEKPQISLFLCKPDRTIIAKLKDAYDINLNIKALQVNELSFKIPLKIDQNNTLITNPNISLIRYRYLIKIVLTNPGNNNNYIEYYQVSTPKAIAAEDSDYKEYTCLSLINELADRQITGYNVNSFTLDQIFNGGYDEIRKLNINGLLHDTNWELGSPGGISNQLTFRRRSINMSSDTTLLNIILSTLVETYNMLPIFDTENRKIYIYSPEEIGKTIDQNILRVSYQKYLQSLDLTEDDSEFTTRLRARGKDDLTLHTVTPTGQPYLENFDYFKVGYVEGVSSSPYWSDNLCAAQAAYEEKLSDYTDEFNNLLIDKLTLQTEKADLDIAAFNALTQLYFTQDILDVLHGLDKGIHRFRNTYDETIVTPEDIIYQGDLNATWYYYVMLNISSLDDLIIKINDTDITSGLTANSWYHNNIIKIYNQDNITIELIGDTNKDIKIDVCRITEDEYTFEGAKEIQVVFLGDVSAATWRLGKSDPINNTETIWTDPLAYNILSNDLQAALAAIYNNSNIIVTKGGSMAEGNVYFQIEFPYSLDGDSHLISDFSEMSAETVPFIIKTQSRMLLLDKYNEDLKQTVYNNAMILVSAKQVEINNIDTQINIIRVDLALENNFTSAEIIERNNYIVEKVYSNPNIINPTDLLEAATEYFNEINEPSLLLNLQTVNFMEVAECHQDFDKLFYNPLMTGLYDTIVVRHELHNINVECMILEINYNFESSEISFTVSNVRQILDDQTKFLKSLNSSTNAAATILSEKYKWDGAVDTSTELDRILSETWSAAERAINSGVDNSVEIGRRGIRITDPTNPLHVIAIVAGWLGISADGGNNYRTVLNADGIAAKYLIGQIIMGAQLHIINQGGNIEIGENGILVYDSLGEKRIHIGNLIEEGEPFDADKYGFEFIGTGNNFIKWDGDKGVLEIGGNLNSVTGNFVSLQAGIDPDNWMPDGITLDQQGIKWIDIWGKTLLEIVNEYKGIKTDGGILNLYYQGNLAGHLYASDRRTLQISADIGTTVGLINIPSNVHIHRDLTVQNNANIKGDLRVDGKLIAGGQYPDLYTGYPVTSPVEPAKWIIDSGVIVSTTVQNNQVLTSPLFDLKKKKLISAEINFIGYTSYEYTPPSAYWGSWYYVGMGSGSSGGNGSTGSATIPARSNSSYNLSGSVSLSLPSNTDTNRNHQWSGSSWIGMSYAQGSNITSVDITSQSVSGNTFSATLHVVNNNWTSGTAWAVFAISRPYTYEIWTRDWIVIPEQHDWKHSVNPKVTVIPDYDVPVLPIDIPITYPNSYQYNGTITPINMVGGTNPSWKPTFLYSIRLNSDPNSQYYHNPITYPGGSALAYWTTGDFHDLTPYFISNSNHSLQFHIAGTAKVDILMSLVWLEKIE